MFACWIVWIVQICSIFMRGQKVEHWAVNLTWMIKKTLPKVSLQLIFPFSSGRIWIDTGMEFNWVVNRGKIKTRLCIKQSAHGANKKARRMKFRHLGCRDLSSRLWPNWDCRHDYQCPSRWKSVIQRAYLTLLELFFKRIVFSSAMVVLLSRRRCLELDVSERSDVFLVAFQSYFHF